MSTRRVPQTLDQRVAELESYVRAVRAQSAVEPLGTRYLFGARGDILVALGPNDPQPLSLPPVGLPTTGVIVPRYNPGTDLGVEWVAIDAPGMISAAV